MRAVSRVDGRQRLKTTVWPVGRWERYADGGREVAIPVLSPVDGPAIREFSEPFRPFVSLYHRRTQANGDRETSALFGLYMSRRQGEHRKVRILGGLLGWGRDGQERHLRLLWALRLRIGRSGEARVAGARPPTRPRPLPSSGECEPVRRASSRSGPWSLRAKMRYQDSRRFLG